jgi:hypothetical protein
MDAAFPPMTNRARSFVISLTEIANDNKPSFSHFEAFDFTSKEWLEVAGTTQPRASRPVAEGGDAILSQLLETSRFAHSTTGEVWVRAVWSGTDTEAVYVDQLVIVFWP